MGSDRLRTGAWVLDRSDRGKLRFTGEQALWFLDQLVTNQILDLESGRGAEALLLTPNGRVVSHMRIIRRGDEVYADVEPGGAEPLLEFFESRVFTTKVEIADVTDEFAIVSVFGAASEQVVATSHPDVLLPGDEEHDLAVSGSLVVVRLARPVRGLDLWCPAGTAADQKRRLISAGAREGAPEDFEALRVVEGLPRFGVDFGERTLPQEAAMERVIHFEKGCYLGQEAVAMAQRGTVKRRLRHLRFASRAVPGRVLFEGREVGEVTSVGSEAEWRGFPRAVPLSGTAIGKGPREGAYGIAMVSTSVPVGAEVLVEGEEGAGPAVVLELPGTLPGPRPPSARELRERLRGAAPPS